MKQPGFTLAELLIALALLGIIAAFTIPKVLQSSAEQEKVAKLRETVATLEQAWYNARATNQVFVSNPENFLYDTLAPRLNVVQNAAGSVGAANAPLSGLVTHPCVTGPANGYFVFQNGVVISGLAPPLMGYSANALLVPQQTTNALICVDLNGRGSPNAMGQDVFFGTFNPWGDFDVGWAGGALYAFSPYGKAFHWGSEGVEVYNWVGQPLDDNGPPWDMPEARVGTWLTR